MGASIRCTIFHSLVLTLSVVPTPCALCVVFMCVFDCLFPNGVFERGSFFSCVFLMCVFVVHF